MVKIPDKALEAGARRIYQHWHLNSADLLPPWELLAAEYRQTWLDQAAGAALAMLEAWPGARERPFWDLMTNTRHIEIILPEA